MAIKKRLTADEFETIRPYLERFDKKNISAIRRVLVDGVMQKEISAELKLSKEAVSALVARAWKAHLEHGQRPDGWRKVEVVLPPEYAEVVEGLAKLVWKQAKK
jgi:FixJ family two-component response regulator